MTRLLRRTSLRHLRRHPGQVLLTVLGVALGVAVVVSIDLAVQSARRAFEVSAETVAGRATHRITGGSGGVDEAVFRAVRVEAGVHLAAPVLEGYASSPAIPGRALQLLGVDPFSEGPFRPWLSGSGPALRAAGEGVDVGTLLTTPSAVLLSAGTAAEAGLEPGDTLPLVVGGRAIGVPLVGVLRESDELGRQGLRDVVVMDVAWAQPLLGRLGELSRIELLVGDDAAGERALERVRALLPPGAELEPVGTRSSTLADMIRAFDLNLTALSLLALVFGMFLIYNAMTFSVVQRRELLGTVRALGVTRGEVLRLVLLEALAIGVVGSALGLLLGVALGRGLVRLVTQTINDLYFVVSVQELAVPPLVLLQGAALGIGATLLAAALPAREAVNAPPRSAQTRSVVEERSRALVPRTALAGVLLLLAGGGLLLVRDVAVNFAGLFGVILGMALLTPAATVGLMRAARPVASAVAGVVGTMAARGVTTALSRTAPAVASLMVAVSVTVGLGVMIDSFRWTVVRWLDRTLQADVYVSPPSPVASRAEGTLEPALVRTLTEAPGLAGYSTYRGLEVETRYGPTRLVALQLDERGERSFQFVSGRPEGVFDAFRQGGAVIVSEPFAYRQRVQAGDTIRLRTDGGERAFPVAGVFYDYGSERGVVMLSRATYDRYWEDPGVTSLGLFLPPGADVEAIVRGLEERVAALPPGPGGAEATAVLRSNRTLRASSLEVFDRTFAITAVLRALAFVVAFIGVLSALMALQLERAREIGVLRANGMTPGQVWKLVMTQTGLMGASAGLLALPAGLVLATVMIFVINRRSFGWTIRMELGPEIFLQAIGLALVGALLAGVYPAWRMSRTSPARALRAE